MKAPARRDKGYHSRAILEDLDGGVWKTRIAEPAAQEFSRWHGDTAARDAVYANRNRPALGGRQGGNAKTREIVERSFTHTLERGGMRRTWLRGRQNVHKRFLIHVAGHNLGLLMRRLIGAGTPKEAANRGRAFLVVVHGNHTLAIVIFAFDETDLAILVVTSPPSQHDHNPTSSTGC